MQLRAAHDDHPPASHRDLSPVMHYRGGSSRHHLLPGVPDLHPDLLARSAAVHPYTGRQAEVPPADADAAAAAARHREAEGPPPGAAPAAAARRQEGDIVMSAIK